MTWAPTWLGNGFWGIRYPALQVILTCIVCYAIYLHFFAFKAQIQVDMELRDQKVSELKVYWASGDLPFEKENYSTVPISWHPSTHRLPIPSLDKIDRLRIDPIDYFGRVNIYRIVITQPGFEPIILETTEDFLTLRGEKHMNPLIAKYDSLFVQTTGKDGQIHMDIEPVRKPGIPVVHLFNLIALTLLVLMAFRIAGLASHELAFVPWMLGCTLILAACMAAISTFNVHPDEIVHFRALDWYNKHYLPPAIDDPRIADSFSQFGKSRLSSYELFYPVAGYFTKLLDPLQVPLVFKSRLFGLTLLGILLLVSIRNPVFCCFTMPLLITPQAWYFFSYINSDVFGVFLSIVASYQAAYDRSALHKYLVDDRPMWFWAKSITLGVLFGSMILLKPNYYFFLLFLGFYLLWRIYHGDFGDRKRLFKRLGILTLVAISMPAIRYGLDIRVNGPETFDKYQDMIEEKASYLYRPSTPLEKKHIYLSQRARGHSLDFVLKDESWGPKTLITSFGSYGYTQYNPGETLYDVIKVTSLLLFLTMILSALIHGPPSTHSLILIAIFSTLLLLWASLWASWDINFQPQGRYIAPALAIGGLIFYHIRPYLLSRVFYPILIAMFCIGLYSYIFIGLRFIAKTSFVYY